MAWGEGERKSSSSLGSRKGSGARRYGHDVGMVCRAVGLRRHSVGMNEILDLFDLFLGSLLRLGPLFVCDLARTVAQKTSSNEASEDDADDQRDKDPDTATSAPSSKEFAHPYKTSAFTTNWAKMAHIRDDPEPDQSVCIIVPDHAPSAVILWALISHDPYLITHLELSKAPFSTVSSRRMRTPRWVRERGRKVDHASWV